MLRFMKDKNAPLRKSYGLDLHDSTHTLKEALKRKKRIKKLKGLHLAKRLIKWAKKWGDYKLNIEKKCKFTTSEACPSHNKQRLSRLIYINRRTNALRSIT
jgi:hypothetical protein